MPAPAKSCLIEIKRRLFMARVEIDEAVLKSERAGETGLAGRLTATSKSLTAEIDFVNDLLARLPANEA